MSKHIAVLIRRVQDTDYVALARFFKENNSPEITRHFHPFPLTPQTAYQTACTSHLDLYYIAISNRYTVGFCMLRGWDEGFEIPSFGIFVDYRHHGLGLGKQMTEFGIDKARKQGCHSIRLSVYESNKRAIRLFKSLGFEQISSQPILVAGEPEVKVIMVKDLKS